MISYSDRKWLCWPVDDFDGVFHGVCVEDAKDGSKDLLLVSGHAGVHSVDDSGTNKIAVGVLVNLFWTKGILYVLQKKDIME